MRRIVFLIAVLWCTCIIEAVAQNQNDMQKIKTAAMDYIEGWYEADEARMKRALHPDLAKRKVFIDPETGESKLRNLTTDQMLKYTKAGGSKDTLIEQRNIEIKILDILKNTASVKIVSVKFTDYVHMIKWKGEWVIINVVWENK